MRIFIIALITAIVSGILSFVCGQLALTVAGWYFVLSLVNLITCITSLTVIIGYVSVMGSPLQAIVAAVVATVLCTIVLGAIYWETNTVDGLNNNLSNHNFMVGGQKFQHEINVNDRIQIGTLKDFVSLNMLNWHYYMNGTDGHWFKPTIYYEPHYADSNPNYSFWFSNGTTIFELYNWEFDIWNRPLNERADVYP